MRLCHMSKNYKRGETKIHIYMQSRRVLCGIEGNKVELCSSGQGRGGFLYWISEEMKLEHVREPKSLWQHSATILHNFKDNFMQKESAQDASFQFFKFISPTIGTWARQKHDPSLTYSYKKMYDLSNYNWKIFRFSKVMHIISYNTTIGVLHGVPSSIVNCTLETLRGRSRFWDHTFPQSEFAKDGIVHDSNSWNLRMSSFEGED